MLREVVRCNSIVSRHCGCAAAMAARSILADEAGGIAATAAGPAKLFKPAAFSSFQLSGPAVWEQLSSPVVWERLYGLAVWEVPGGLDNVSATIFSLPGIYLMSAVNSAT
jgi:hypothetical protein